MINHVTQDMLIYLESYQYQALLIAMVCAAFKFLLSIAYMLIRKRNHYWVRWKRILFACPIDFMAVFYTVMVIAITLLSRSEGSTDIVNLELFSTFAKDEQSVVYVIENVVMFLPLGIFLGWYGKKHWLICVLLIPGLSILIEVLQFVSGRGKAEIDDVLTNGIGGLVGFLLIELILHAFRREKKRI